MYLTTYERLIKTENAERNYLPGLCFENHQRFYPRCKGKKLYRLADDRRRCSSCHYTLHDFSGRWEGFWSYAVERIMKHHGVSPERFPFYLKELEFRTNHRKEDLFPLITKCLCNLVPKRDESPNKEYSS